MLFSFNVSIEVSQWLDFYKLYVVLKRTRIPFDPHRIARLPRENLAETNFHSLYERQHDEREIENDFDATEKWTAEK